ncbi:conserved hypothetical protein [Talaromyces stipitatus ATCC 10500]|uniref:Voltage-gated hydrogen channel 1 n=1 Tax=Talaromyces stipitatus (strain ATCC 10500 / CBS 375.48 / QM 6759 / NRRL 1006) TaxID=441959 RepID=B8LY96_TALSN|nr:uncharacterized protein TSTA_067730 [Talaromyces stipitatus ATCC 10500]EED23341.1 conserved hypothetical protein [Talaromyces stipitatus ATCC 10500]
MSELVSPLLGDHNTDLENQPQTGNKDKHHHRSKTFPLPTSVEFSRDVSGSRFIGNLASWSKKGVEGLGISRNSSYNRQYHEHQQSNEEQQYYDDDEYPYDVHPNTSYYAHLRAKTRAFLSSKWGHYIVLCMVAVDVACIFADFLIELWVCELSERHQTPIDRRWSLAQEALGLVGLIFSCLFMLELIASVLSFGLGYFRSKFHTFDALVIVLAFILDIALRGVVEELGSLIVVLRLWRVFKIIEEMSEVSAEMMERYEVELDNLRVENSKLRRKLKGYGYNDEGDDIEGNIGGDEEVNE